MQRVELQGVAPESAAVLENLLQLYCHELSPYFGLRIGEDGRYDYPALPAYWHEPEHRFAYFIRVDGELAGFALATRGSPATSDPTHMDLAEFFVLRALRRRAVGEHAASLLWERHGGHWVVRAAVSNEPAVRFWRTAVDRYSGGSFGERRMVIQGTTRVVFELDVQRSSPSRP